MAQQSEKQFENKVKAYLKAEGCWTLKTWGGGMQRSGIPDLLVCCNGYFLAIELKAANGKPSELQKWNVKKIQEAGGIGLILYPDQFPQFKELVELLKMAEGISRRKEHESTL